MAFPIFINGVLLFAGGAPAMSGDCCCDYPLPPYDPCCGPTPTGCKFRGPTSVTGTVFLDSDGYSWAQNGPSEYGDTTCSFGVPLIGGPSGTDLGGIEISPASAALVNNWSASWVLFGVPGYPLGRFGGGNWATPGVCGGVISVTLFPAGETLEFTLDGVECE